MKKEFVEYLESIGLTGSMVERVENIYNFYTKILGHNIDDIFVSEYISKEGSRIYEDLLFFNESMMFEAKTFIVTDEFDCDMLSNVDYITITKTEYDILTNTTTDKSRITVEFPLLNTERYGELKASKDNCKSLWQIYMKYINPKFRIS